MHHSNVWDSQQVSGVLYRQAHTLVDHHTMFAGFGCIFSMLSIVRRKNKSIIFTPDEILSHWQVLVPVC
jgi:hypothetical protein